MADSEPRGPEQSGGSQDRAVCPKCMTPNDPREHFCSKCATPMSSFAAIDPIFSIWARGDTWRMASSRPTSRIVLIGMWLLCVPAGLYFAVVLIWIWSAPAMIQAESGDQLSDLFASLVLLAVMALYAAIVIKTTRNYLRHARGSRAESNEPKNDGAE